MEEVIVHQSEELSCPTKDLHVWPRYDLALVEPGLLFEHFFILQPFATTDLTSVISHLKAWEAELLQEGKDRFGASPVLDIYLSITTEHSRIQQPHCSQKWRIKIMQIPCLHRQIPGL